MNVLHPFPLVGRRSEMSPYPPHVIFDTTAQTATWTSSAGSETVDLAAPLIRDAVTPS